MVLRQEVVADGIQTREDPLMLTIAQELQGAGLLGHPTGTHILLEGAITHLTLQEEVIPQVEVVHRIRQGGVRLQGEVRILREVGVRDQVEARVLVDPLVVADRHLLLDQEAVTK